MQLTLRFSGGNRSDFGDHDYEEVLLRSLERFRNRLKRVSFYVEDVNGPRGGVDKQCRFVLHLRRMPAVVVQDQDACMKTLIHRVAERASYAVSQRVDRKNKRVKQGRRNRPPIAPLEVDEMAFAGTIGESV